MDGVFSWKYQFSLLLQENPFIDLFHDRRDKNASLESFLQAKVDFLQDYLLQVSFTERILHGNCFLQKSFKIFENFVLLAK